MVTRIIKSKDYSYNNLVLPEGEFTIDKMLSVEGARNKIYYCSKYLPFIGRGSGRMVYRLNDERVIKLATNSNGTEQNKNECDEEIQALSCVVKVFEHDENYEWLIAQYAEDVTRQDFVDMFGFSFQDIWQWILDKGNLEVLNEKYPEKTAVFAAMNTQFFSDLKLFSNMGVKELNNLTAWGKVKNQNNEYKIVARDFGFIVKEV